MIVRHPSSIFIDKQIAVSQLPGSLPDLLINVRRKLLGIGFFQKDRILTSYHIKQNSETGIVSLNMRIARPILCAQTPRLFVILIVRSIIFRIKKDDVDSKLRLLLMNQTGNLQQRPRLLRH